MFVIWSKEDEKGLTIPYQNISLHAAQAAGSRGNESKACIYMQLDGATHLLSDVHANGNDEEEEDEGVTELVELHITPDDESTCTSPPIPLPINLPFWSLVSGHGNFVHGEKY